MPGLITELLTWFEFALTNILSLQNEMTNHSMTNPYSWFEVETNLDNLNALYFGEFEWIIFRIPLRVSENPYSRISYAVNTILISLLKKLWDSD